MDKSNDGILEKSLNKAFKGGITGSSAMFVQVGSLMWLRTTMNYQYRYGGTFTGTLRHLYNDGGIGRFYRGVGPALLQGPLSRFGDTAANAGVLSFLNSHEKTKDLSIGTKTFCASGMASLWRVNLMPIDTLKTTLHIEGKNAIPLLKNKFKVGGPSIFYHGAGGAFAATYVGHFPWYFTFNYLDNVLPQYKESLPKQLVRNASIGFSASVLSDCVSNSFRVIKASKQSYHRPISYFEVTNQILQQDGIIGLTGRGLKVRIMSNALQGMMFSVIWKLLMDYTD